MTADTTTTIPAGWKLVPEDATDAMVAAALKCDWTHEDEAGIVHDVYHSMISAAPAAPSSLTPDEREYLLSRVTSELADYSGDQRHMTKHAAERADMLRGLADKLRGGVAVAPVAAEVVGILRDMTALFEMTDEAQQPGTDSYTVLKQAQEVLRAAGEGK